MATAGLVLGILAIATSFIYIGLILGILGLIFSVIARKKEKSGMVTAGLVCSIVGVFLSSIMIATAPKSGTKSGSSTSGGIAESSISVQTSSKDETYTSESAGTVEISAKDESVANESGVASSSAVENINLADLMETTLYTGQASFDDDGYAALYVTNTSDSDVSIEVTFTAKDSLGNAIASASDQEYVVAAGQDVLLLGYFDTFKDDSTCDYSMRVEEAKNTKSMHDAIDLKENTTDENLVFTATNNSDENAYFLEVKAVFLKARKIVSTGYTYLINDSDSAIDAGQTLSGEIYIPYDSDYDKVIYTYTARDDF